MIIVRNYFKIIVAQFLLLIYLSGILNDFVVTTAHIVHHMFTHTIHLHFDHHHSDTIHQHNHSHGDFLDKALSNVGKDDSRDEPRHSQPTMRFSRVFDHLSYLRCYIFDPDSFSNNLWTCQSTNPEERFREPLLPPPEAAFN